MRSTVLSLLLLAFSPAISGEQANLLDFELKSLLQPEYHALGRYEGRPLVMVFFQPECNWCAKQVRAINELRERCDFEAIAVGVGGTRAELRKELRRIRPDFPAYQASPRLIEAMGGVLATPMTLLGDADGAFLNWSRGFLSGGKLQQLMQTSGQTAC